MFLVVWKHFTTYGKPEFSPGLHGTSLALSNLQGNFYKNGSKNGPEVGFNWAFPSAPQIMPQAEACRAVRLSQTWTRISSSWINVQQRPSAEYSIYTGSINGPLSQLSKLTVSLYGINNSSFSQRNVATLTAAAMSVPSVAAGGRSGSCVFQWFIRLPCWLPRSRQTPCWLQWQAP